MKLEKGGMTVSHNTLHASGSCGLHAHKDKDTMTEKRGTLRRRRAVTEQLASDQDVSVSGTR